MTTKRPSQNKSLDVPEEIAVPRTVSSSRRPQAQRSAETKAKLIEAAITCLHRVGYSATTVTMVADEAKVSRGAMSHQYPTKTDLMLAVVDEVFEQDSQYYNRAMDHMSPTQWLAELPSTMWDVISQPSGTAVMEIMLASRSEPDLASQLRTMQKAIDVRAHEWIVERMADAGVRDRPDGEAVHRLFVAAVRGLSLEALFRRNHDDVVNSVAVLGEILHLLYPALKAKPSKPRK